MKLTEAERRANRARWDAMRAKVRAMDAEAAMVATGGGPVYVDIRCVKCGRGYMDDSPEAVIHPDALRALGWHIGWAAILCPSHNEEGG